MAETEEHYDHIAQLIRAYQTGKIDPAAQAELDAWRLADPVNQELFDQLNSPMQLNTALKEMNQFNAVARLAEFEHKYIDKPPVKIWTRIAVVAASAAITLGIWLYYIPSKSIVNHKSDVVNHHDIAPGKNTATLTLANGKVINLSDAKTGVVIDASKLTYSDGTAVSSSLRGGTTKQSHQHSQDEIASSRSASRNDVTVKTPRGGTYQVILPDGTQVWLNADSKISFPSKFISQERKISLQGEAYFAVSHDKSKPFIVKTDQQEVTVLGTEFNINAYGDGNRTMTTLLKGSVKVNAAKQVILKPGQQSNLTNGQLRVQTADIESATGWKNGIFLFYNTDMRSIMRQLARWYNIEVDISSMPDKRFYGEISRDVKLSEVLTMLEATGDTKFKIEGRRLMLLK